MKVINKRKIINDPVHGFISIPGELLFDLMEHPFVQRLRRIKQLGMTSLVYPGATHTRFQHSVGCMHLMSAAVNTLLQKGHEITPEESEAVHIAILLHDLGHGPFSHLLEATLVQGIHHEELSLLFMERLNQQLEGRLSMAIEIFTNKYHKKFLHQLVSSQLDMDRLDYLRRDSFYTGVSEGVISSDRIIKMLNIHNDELAVEVKGIYSIEKFLIARRLMYWQVYLHKTALVAEQMLGNVFKRARELATHGEKITTLPNLDFFIQQTYSMEDFRKNDSVLNHFAQLDDSDVMSALKIWTQHPDRILSTLSQGLVNRRLLAIEIGDDSFSKERVNNMRELARKQMGLSENDPIEYFVFTDSISNNTYSVSDDKINILYADQKVKDISEASDMLNLSVLGKTVRKFFLCYPKSIR